MHRLTFCFSAIFLCIFLFPRNCFSAKILCIDVVSSRSQKISYERLLHTLAGRGHEVTILSSFKPLKTVKNVREILTFESENFLDFDDNDGKGPINLFEFQEREEEFNPFLMLNLFAKACQMTYDLPQVKELMKEKFDLVILQIIFNECAAGLVHHFNTTTILFSPLSVPSWISGIFGNPTPVSFVPNLFLNLGERMTFYERAINLLTTTVLTLSQDYSYKPSMEALYREKLNDPNIPSNDEILRNASLILSNSHFALGQARPFLPDIVEVGGMHCTPAKPLPKVYVETGIFKHHVCI